MNEIITQDGEVIEGLGQSSSMAVQLQKAEIDQLITTARAYPRSLKRVQSAIMNMATLDEESAEECMYALPRGGKPIKGPSVRFAEILKQSYGNCRAAARVVHVDRIEMFVEAEGIFHDLETNSATTTRVRRRISDKRGKVFTDDMIIVTGNAACAIAKRNAILDGIPKPLWRKAYDTVQATITGDVTTLSENREKALKALAAFGVKPEQIFGALGKEGLDDITVDDIATLRGMYSALKNGEATVEEMFLGTVKASSQHEKVADPLSDDPIKPQDAPSAEEHERASDAPSEAGNALDEAIIEPNTNSGSSPSQEPDADDNAPSSSAEGSEAPSSGPSTNSDELDFDDRKELIECCQKLMYIVVDPDLSSPETRRGVLIAAKDAWKMRLKIELHQHLKSFVDSADGQIKATKEEFAHRRANALEYFSDVLGCPVEDLGGGNG